MVIELIAAMARIILTMASEPSSFLLMCVARPRVWMTRSMLPVCLVMMVRAPYGSGTTAMSVR